MSALLTVLRQAILLGLALASGAVLAAAGTVTHLSGTLSVQRPDGSVRILSQKSEVNPGDLLTTQRDSYAQINMTDGSSMTMRPNTQMRIEQYTFVQDRPQDDNSFLRLVKGGLRTVTGLVGKRGNQDAYKIGTNTATIGIRGTSLDALDCTEGCEAVTPTSHLLERALFLTTYTGTSLMQVGETITLVPEGQFAVLPIGSIVPQVQQGIADKGLSQLPFILGVGSTTPGGMPAECQVR